ncbi:beta-glucosidase H [Ferrimonas balearica]|uniref:beta-glucosidase H n=1 Tax=Ferrimonas balearica TaxID=44012 RepID=UPI001C993B25|nr:glycoside hydrolase family 3 C-terminal domain-containing protein [Ferrimonas balearica]MBY5991379.1 glycoside hydrolase family 3 C-terminal domain-containing protein [Ferrimonas balearica]
MIAPRPRHAARPARLAPTALALALLAGCSHDARPPAEAVAAIDSRAARLASVEADVEALLAQMTLDEKIALTHANSKFTVAGIERLGIPEMWMSDGPHGVRYQIERDSWAPANWDNDQATYLPPLTAVAASWNPEMAALHGSVLGSEARERGKDVILGPGVNLARLPLYGRNFEYMGEDPYLAATLVVPAVQAIQANDVAASVKHYALNTQELNRTGVNAKPDERTLREVYLPAFEAAVKAGGTHTIMGAYNEVHGTNANQSRHLVMDILKGEWGYQGVLLTDWNVDINTYDAAMNGLDIEMGTDVEHYDDYFLAQPLKAMIEEGRVPISVLDDKVRRVLRVQHSIGMMDPNRRSGERNTEAHQTAARAIIREGIVLLKNEAVLPLDAGALKNVLVMGPNADKRHALGGGSSEVKALYEITPLEGLQAALGENVAVTVLRGLSSAGLGPIPGDFVASRHWTGTPAWQLAKFKDGEAEPYFDDWQVDSAYTVAEPGQTESIRLRGILKPRDSGEHRFQVKADGQFRLSLDGEPLMALENVDGQLVEQPVTLSAGQEYQVEVHYQGDSEFTLGWQAPGNLFTDAETYMAAAAEADAVIYYGGLSHADDRESIDRPDMVLPGGQDEIIQNLLSANPNTVVFIGGGSAVEMPWADQAKALLWGGYGGMEGGHAYAEVLLGQVNPSGKMPITLPRRLEDTAPIALDDYNATDSLYKEGVFIGYRWFEQQGIAPLFPFGHGLSYTQFDHSQLTLSGEQFSDEQGLEVTVTVTNTGKVAGAEVVQLYLEDMDASVPRPAKELKGFGKIALQPGESAQVTLPLRWRDLAFWDVEKNDWTVEPGQFRVHVGASVADIRQSAVFEYR